jgi:RNA polymerase sigma factor (sigma-70 family)
MERISKNGYDEKVKDAHLKGCTEKGGSENQTDEFFIKKTFEVDPEQGVELLFLRYYQPLCTHAVKFVRCRQVAEDIVSETFYTFYTKRLFEQVTSSYRSYLFKAVRNRGYNYLRWELDKNAELEEDQSAHLPEYQQPDMITQYEELYHDLEKAIETLPLQRKSIYLQFQFEGKSVKEIAHALVVSTRTIETQIYRARNAVREHLKAKWLVSLLSLALSFC